MGEERGVYQVLVGKPEGKSNWGYLGVSGWIILGCVCGEWSVYSFLMGKPGGKGPLGRPRRRRLDNIIMGLWV